MRSEGPTPIVLSSGAALTALLSPYTFRIDSPHGLPCQMSHLRRSTITSASEIIRKICVICGQNKRNGLIWFIWNYKGGSILPPLCICRTEVVFRVNKGGPVLGRPRHRDITKPVPRIRAVVLQGTSNKADSQIGNDDNLSRNTTTISERCQQTQFNINQKL